MTWTLLHHHDVETSRALLVLKAQHDWLVEALGEPPRKNYRVYRYTKGSVEWTRSSRVESASWLPLSEAERSQTLPRT